MLKLISIVIFIVIVFFGLFHSSQVTENFNIDNSKYNKLMGNINDNADQPFDIDNFKKEMNRVSEDSNKGIGTINQIIASGELESIQKDYPNLNIASIKNNEFDRYSTNLNIVNYSSRELYAILTNVINSDKPNQQISEFKNILSTLLSACCKLLEKEQEDTIHIDSKYLDKCISTSNTLDDIGKLHKIINRTYMYITDAGNNSNINLYPVLVSEFNTQMPKLMDKGREIVFETSNKCYCYGEEKLHRFLRKLKRKQKYIENLQKEINKIDQDLRKLNNEIKTSQRKIYSEHNRIAQIKNVMRNPVRDRKLHCWNVRRYVWWRWRTYRRCRWHSYNRARNSNEIKVLQGQIDSVKQQIKKIDAVISNNVNKRTSLSNKINQKYDKISTINSEISVLNGQVAEERRKLKEPCQPC